MQLVRFRVDLAPRCSLGPGKISLLEAIAELGSLTKAAVSLGMSYRYAWLLLQDLNASFTEPVTHATVGGARGGGVRLTRFGGEVVRRYHATSHRIDAAARRSLGPLLGKAAKRPRAADKRARSVKRPA
ncbi:MAG: LysR family transcriptional regulator [Pseudomonadota bacterium]